MWLLGHFSSSNTPTISQKSPEPRNFSHKTGRPDYFWERIWVKKKKNPYCNIIIPSPQPLEGKQKTSKGDQAKDGLTSDRHRVGVCGLWVVFLPSSAESLCLMTSSPKMHFQPSCPGSPWGARRPGFWLGDPATHVVLRASASLCGQPIVCPRQ